MADPTADGRMINRAIAYSDGFSKLSPEAAVLFCMIIPHFSAQGKLNGEPEYIKAVTCPKISYIPVDRIQFLLEEISENTNVKWFRAGNRWWLHSLNFLKEHQKLRKDRLGRDTIPDYPGNEVPDQSRTSPGPVRREVEVEVEVEVEEKDNIPPPEGDGEYIARCKTFYNEMMEGKHGPLEETWEKLYGDAINVPSALFIASTWLIENPRNRKKNFKKFYGNWLRNQYTRATQPRGGY